MGFFFTENSEEPFYRAPSVACSTSLSDPFHGFFYFVFRIFHPAALLPFASQALAAEGRPRKIVSSQTLNVLPIVPGWFVDQGMTLECRELERTTRSPLQRLRMAGRHSVLFDIFRHSVAAADW
jgi:hypothetical protein